MTLRKRPEDAPQESPGDAGAVVWVLSRGEADAVVSAAGIRLLCPLQAEQALAAARSEQEMRLREMHHRLKNQLQIIMSLFDAQSSMSKAPRSTPSSKRPRPACAPLPCCTNTSPTPPILPISICPPTSTSSSRSSSGSTVWSGNA
jgi:hypothetical protein